MNAFLRAIPSAASSPYAFVAYALAAILMAFGGFKLLQLRSILQGLKNKPDLPPDKIREIIEIATNTKMPITVSAEQWLENNRFQGFVLIFISIIIALVTIVAVAIARRSGDVTIHLPPLNDTDPFPLIVLRHGEKDKEAKWVIEGFTFPVSDIKKMKNYKSFLYDLLAKLPTPTPIPVGNITIFRYVDEKVVSDNNFDLLSNRNTSALIIPNDFIAQEGSPHMAFTRVRYAAEGQIDPNQAAEGVSKKTKADNQ